MDDDVDESNGTLSIEILEDPKKTDNTMDATYLLGTKITSSIMVEDNDVSDVPVLSISSDAVDTGVTEGFSFKFTVSSDREISILTPLTFTAPMVSTNQQSGASNFISPSILETTFEIHDNLYDDGISTEFTVRMNPDADVSPSDDVSITVKLVDGTGYSLSSKKSITVKVKDNDTPSASNVRITMSTRKNYFAHGDTFEYYLTVSELTTNDLTVNFDLLFEYLHPTPAHDSRPYSVKINSSSELTSKVEVPNVDGDTRVDGINTLVSLTIIEGAGYSIQSSKEPRTATIVTIDELPEISIARNRTSG